MEVYLLDVMFLLQDPFIVGGNIVEQTLINSCEEILTGWLYVSGGTFGMKQTKVSSNNWEII